MMVVELYYIKHIKISGTGRLNRKWYRFESIRDVCSMKKIIITAMSFFYHHQSNEK